MDSDVSTVPDVALLQRFVAAAAGINRVMNQVARAVNTTADAFHRHLAHLQEPRSVHRCPRCRPYSNPRPLCIDGRAYQQRRKNRRTRP